MFGENCWVYWEGKKDCSWKEKPIEEIKYVI